MYTITIQAASLHNLSVKIDDSELQKTKKFVATTTVEKTAKKPGPKGGNMRALQWTPEEDKTLIELHNQKVPGREIAKKLNRPLSAIYSRVNNLRKDGVEIPNLKQMSALNEQ